MRNVNDKLPCDPSHPSHSLECCDRKPRYKKSNHEENIRRNGQCYFWKQGFCKKGDFCSYLYVEICLYQDQCRYPSTCWYIHDEKDAFLGMRREQQFMYREEDFPTLDQSNRNKGRNW